MARFSSQRSTVWWSICIGACLVWGLSCQSDAEAIDPAIQAQADSLMRAEARQAFLDSVALEKEKETVIYHIQHPSPWVDSVFNTLSDEDKIAQLFTVAIYPYKESSDTKMKTLLSKHAIGGIIVMKGGPKAAANQINRYQDMSRIPLLVSTDGEWGVKMRLDSVIRFPYQSSLGAMQGDSLVYLLGEAIGRHHRRVGIHVNFAPVVDINNNPNNPVIGMRSFGEDKENVASKGLAYAMGMQDQKVMAIGKHFPGHGDTDVDSHFDLPVISHSMDRLTDVELYPFQHLISNGLGGLMTTHLYVPAIDSTPNLAAGLSEKAVGGILREKMGFEGLIYTDALNMKGVTKHFPNGQIDVMALKAGNDVMLMSEDINVSIAAVTQAIEDSVLTWEEIDSKVRKILAVKYWAGLDQYEPTSLAGLVDDLNDDASKSLNQALANASLTRLRNTNQVLPVPANTDTLKVAVVTVGKSSRTTFRTVLNESRVKFEHFYVSSGSSTSTATSTYNKVKNHDIVIVAAHSNAFRPKNNYGITSGMKAAIEKLGAHPNSTLCVFADPYALGKMGDLSSYQAILCGYQNTAYTHRAAVAAILGEWEPQGIFPVTVNEQFKVGMWE